MVRSSIIDTIRSNYDKSQMFFVLGKVKCLHNLTNTIDYYIKNNAKF